MAAWPSGFKRPSKGTHIGKRPAVKTVVSPHIKCRAIPQKFLFYHGKQSPYFFYIRSFGIETPTNIVEGREKYFVTARNTSMSSPQKSHVGPPFLFAFATQSSIFC